MPVERIILLCPDYAHLNWVCRTTVIKRITFYVGTPTSKIPMPHIPHSISPYSAFNMQEYLCRGPGEKKIMPG